MKPNASWLTSSFREALLCQALVICLSVCGCTISSSKEEYATAKGKVKAELFKASKKRLGLACAGGHSIGICVPKVRKSVTVVLKVGTKPPTFVSAWRCKDPESGAWLAVGPVGKRVAYRCGKKGKRRSWSRRSSVRSEHLAAGRVVEAQAPGIVLVLELVVLGIPAGHVCGVFASAAAHR